jgi:hypothetical protein
MAVNKFANKLIITCEQLRCIILPGARTMRLQTRLRSSFLPHFWGLRAQLTLDKNEENSAVNSVVGSEFQCTFRYFYNYV